MESEGRSKWFLIHSKQIVVDAILCNNFSPFSPPLPCVQLIHFTKKHTIVKYHQTLLLPCFFFFFSLRIEYDSGQYLEIK